MWRILRNLYLGDQQDAENRFVLERCGITHIVNCASELRCRFRGDFRYLHLELSDPDPAFADCIPKVCSFIHAGRRRGAVLVHCRKAMSRSPALILAYLLSRGKTYEQACRLLRRGVGEEDCFAEPHEVFLEQLRDHFEDRFDDEVE
jgi:hypothetical protein